MRAGSCIEKWSAVGVVGYVRHGLKSSSKAHVPLNLKSETFNKLFWVRT